MPRVLCPKACPLVTPRDMGHSHLDACLLPPQHAAKHWRSAGHFHGSVIVCMQGKSPIKAKLGQKNEFYFDEKARIGTKAKAA